MNVFYAEDDPDDREIFMKVVCELNPNATVITATNGLEALGLLTSITDLPEIIFLDINMPMMDGISCLRELKRNKRYENIPVIVYSTTSDENQIKKATAAGAIQFLKKADSYKAMLVDIQSVLKKYVGV